MSLFTTATKSLPKIVDLYTPGESTSSTPSSSSLVSAVSAPVNQGSSVVEKAVSAVKSKSNVKATSADVSNATGTNFSISSLSNTAVKNLNSFLKEDSTVGKKAVKLLDGTIVKGITTELNESAKFQGMVEQIHGLCKGTSIHDRTTARAVNDTLLLEALLMGLAGLIDCMADVTGLDFSATRIAKKGIVAARKGDAASLASLSRLVGQEKLNAQNPNIVNTLLKNYTLAGDRNPNSYANAGVTLVDQINTINPNWMRSRELGDNVQDVSALRGISPDARTVLNTQESTAMAMRIAGDTPNESKSVLMRRFNKTNYANGLTA